VQPGTDLHGAVRDGLVMRRSKMGPPGSSRDMHGMILDDMMERTLKAQVAAVTDDQLLIHWKTMLRGLGGRNR
jgi:hypothetical protein